MKDYYRSSLEYASLHFLKIIWMKVCERLPNATLHVCETFKKFLLDTTPKCLHFEAVPLIISYRFIYVTTKKGSITEVNTLRLSKAGHSFLFKWAVFFSCHSVTKVLTVLMMDSPRSDIPHQCWPKALVTLVCHNDIHSKTSNNYANYETIEEHFSLVWLSWKEQ